MATEVQGPLKVLSQECAVQRKGAVRPFTTPVNSSVCESDGHQRVFSPPKSTDMQIEVLLISLRALVSTLRVFVYCRDEFGRGGELEAERAVPRALHLLPQARRAAAQSRGQYAPRGPGSFTCSARVKRFHAQGTITGPGSWPKVFPVKRCSAAFVFELVDTPGRCKGGGTG